MSETNGVREALAWAKVRAKRTLKPKTKDDYSRHYARVSAAGEVAGTETNPRSRHKSRAAARYCIALSIIDAQSQGDNARVLALWNEVKQIQHVANKNVEAYEAGEDFKWNPKNSKSKSIRKLPEDWQERVLNAMAKSKSYTAACIMAATGCRPAEIETGVSVKRLADGRIQFEISGAKVHGQIGQSSRLITFDKSHQIASAIKDGFYKAGARQVSEAITRAAIKCEFKDVSGYSFRHQFCADLKASRYKKHEIADAMGHQSESTQENYGNRGAGKKGLKIEASATQQTRPGRRGRALKSKNKVGFKINLAALKNNGPKPR